MVNVRGVGVIGARLSGADNTARSAKRDDGGSPGCADRQPGLAVHRKHIARRRFNEWRVSGSGGVCDACLMPHVDCCVWLAVNFGAREKHPRKIRTSGF